MIQFQEWLIDQEFLSLINLYHEAARYLQLEAVGRSTSITGQLDRHFSDILGFMPSRADEKWMRVIERAVHRKAGAAHAKAEDLVTSVASEIAAEIDPEGKGRGPESSSTTHLKFQELKSRLPESEEEIKRLFNQIVNKTIIDVGVKAGDIGVWYKHGWDNMLKGDFRSFDDPERAQKDFERDYPVNPLTGSRPKVYPAEKAKWLQKHGYKNVPQGTTQFSAMGDEESPSGGLASVAPRAGTGPSPELSPSAGLEFKSLKLSILNNLEKVLKPFRDKMEALKSSGQPIDDRTDSGFKSLALAKAIIQDDLMMMGEGGRKMSGTEVVEFYKKNQDLGFVPETKHFNRAIEEIRAATGKIYPGYAKSTELM